jgi:nucleotide-binding universal stress UspA family protein
VVVAYDGSDASRAAVRTARRLFAGRPAVAVRAGADSAIASEGAALAREHGLRCTSETITRDGAAEAVLAAAGSADASAVIAGSRGRGAVASTLLGSFSTSLLREASLPVLIAKAA